MGKLTTHVLDVSCGKPAGGVAWTLYRVSDTRKKISSGKTNSDGRTDSPLLEDAMFELGTYELVFEIGEYFCRKKLADANSLFLNQVPVRFSISNNMQNYHVPLLASPYSYSTYRGS